MVAWTVSSEIEGNEHRFPLEPSEILDADLSNTERILSSKQKKY